MEKIKYNLRMRRRIGVSFLFFIGILGYFIHIYYSFVPPLYVSPRWRMPLVYLLLAYKLVELSMFYFFFYHKPYHKLLSSLFHTQLEENFKKNAKRFFFLVPQGSIVFGFLAYKLSADIIYLWVFLLIAFMALILVNPNRLKES